MKTWEKQIEVTKRKSLMHLPFNLLREADFVLDLTTFKILKHRWGGHSASPEQAAWWLTEYMKDPLARILLLVD